MRYLAPKWVRAELVPCLRFLCQMQFFPTRTAVYGSKFRGSGVSESRTTVRPLHVTGLSELCEARHALFHFPLPRRPVERARVMTPVVSGSRLIAEEGNP